MATVTKLTPTGIQYSNELDEVTFNTNSGYKKNLIWYSNNLGNISYWQGFCARGLSGYNGDTTNFTYNVTEVAAPDGTLTATKFLTGNVQACGIGAAWGLLTTTTGIFTANTTYTVSIWARVKEGTALLDLGLNDYYSSYGNQLTTEWRRITYTATPNGIPAATLDRGIQFTCTNKNVTVYVWGPQLEIGSQATIYEPTGANGIPLSGPVKRVDANGKIYIAGFFDEVTFNPSSNVKKNLISYSQQFNNTSFWTQARSRINLTNIAAPDNSPTATQIIEDGISSQYKGFSFQINSGVDNNLTYTISVYVKSNNRNFEIICKETGTFSRQSYVGFNLNTGTVLYNSAFNGITVNSTNITLVSNEWYRCSVTYTIGGTATGQFFQFNLLNGNTISNSNYTGDGISSINLWGAQLELGSSPSIYEATGANAVPLSNVVMKMESTGNTYTIGSYDEYSGIVSTTDKLAVNLDAAFLNSYPGTGYIWSDISGVSGYYTFYQSLANQSTFNSNNSINLSNTNYQGYVLIGVGGSSANTPLVETTEFSVETWVKHSSFNSNGKYWNTITLKELYQVNGFRTGINTPNGLSTDTTGAPTIWSDQSGGTIATSTPTYPLSLNTWYQLLITYDGTIVKVYINGVLYSSQIGKIYPSTGRPLYIGGNPAGNFSMSGQIASWKWYTKALSSVEVYDNFNGLRTRFGI